MQLGIHPYLLIGEIEPSVYYWGGLSSLPVSFPVGGNKFHSQCQTENEFQKTALRHYFISLLQPLPSQINLSGKYRCIKLCFQVTWPMAVFNFFHRLPFDLTFLHSWTPRIARKCRLLSLGLSGVLKTHTWGRTHSRNSILYLCWVSIPFYCSTIDIYLLLEYVSWS